MTPFKFKKTKENPTVNIGSWIENQVSLLTFGDWEIVIQKPKRNNDQNALMWAWFNCLAKDSGNEMQDYYDYYTKLFLLRIINVNGKDEKVVSGTSKLNVSDFAEFLTKIQAHAASEMGIQLPNRDDIYYAEFLKQYSK